MIKEVKTSWRPFLELHEVALNDDGVAEETGNIFYYNYAKASDLIQTDQGAVIVLDNLSIRVKESVKDICKKIDKIIEAEAKRVTEEARDKLATQIEKLQAEAKAN